MTAKVEYVKRGLTGKQRFTRLVGAPGAQPGLKSGLVVLKKGESVGCHNTKGKEEIIIILRGKASIKVGDKNISISRDQLFFIPRNCCHDVRNAGRGALKYVYITAQR